MKKLNFSAIFALSLCYNVSVTAQGDYLNDAYRLYQEKNGSSRILV